VAANAGAAGAGAAAEVTRRLMVELRVSAERADQQAATLTALTRWLLVLTSVLVVLTIALVVDAIGGVIG
jgi:hypothetical protein